MNEIEFKGLLISQRTTPQSNSDGELFIMAALASAVLQWAHVDRTKDNAGGAQRLLSKTHHNRIRSFANASDQNLIPTAVTIALPPDSYTVSSNSIDRVRAATLTILDKDECPGKIIDGQHRLHGLKDLDIPIPVTVILGADKLERALQFVVINNSARRVPTDLVKGIFAELSDEEQATLSQRLSKSGLTLGKFNTAVNYINTWDESPFRGLIDWEINRDGESIIKVAAVEKALRIILARLETFEPIDLDSAVEIFVALWNGILKTWDSSAGDWKSSKLIEKAGLVACVEFTVERLNQQGEEGVPIHEAETVCEHAKRLFLNVPAEFWLANWSQKGLDTDAGRSLIKKALREVRRAVAGGVSNPLNSIKSLSIAGP